MESDAAGPSAEFSVVSQERVMNRLNAALNDLRVGYDEVGKSEGSHAGRSNGDGDGARD